MRRLWRRKWRITMTVTYPETLTNGNNQLHASRDHIAGVIAANPGFELLAAYQRGLDLIVDRCDIVAWRIAGDALPVPIALEAPHKPLTTGIKQPCGRVVAEWGTFVDEANWLADAREEMELAREIAA
jgi:hypothetical protein